MQNKLTSYLIYQICTWFGSFCWFRFLFLRCWIFENKFLRWWKNWLWRLVIDLEMFMLLLDTEIRYCRNPSTTIPNTYYSIKLKIWFVHLLCFMTSLIYQCRFTNPYILRCMESMISLNCHRIPWGLFCNLFRRQLIGLLWQ